MGVAPTSQLDARDLEFKKTGARIIGESHDVFVEFKPKSILLYQLHDSAIICKEVRELGFYDDGISNVEARHASASIKQRPYFSCSP